MADVCETVEEYEPYVGIWSRLVGSKSPDRREAAFTDVKTQAIDVPTVFGDFDGSWTPFLGGQALAPTNAMSSDKEQRGTLRGR